jgi:hypothetical protein
VASHLFCVAEPEFLTAMTRKTAVFWALTEFSSIKSTNVSEHIAVRNPSRLGP